MTGSGKSMKQLPSVTFRKVYAKLMEPTVVTVYGHVIGVWTPRNQVATREPGEYTVVTGVSDAEK